MRLSGDRVFALIVAILVVGGAAIFLSAALGLLAREGASIGRLALTQLALGLIPGVIALIAIRFTPPLLLMRAVVPFYVLSIILTALVFVPGLGVHAGGATRWIDVGPVTLQPAEFLKPAVLLIDRITNDTTSDFPIDNLVYAMREQLVNSGQAAVNTTYGANPESKLAQDEAKLDQFETGERVRIKNDFALTGRITEVRRAAGNVRQATFTFRLTLTATSGPRKGLEVWTKQAQFTKQGTKASVGF